MIETLTATGADKIPKFVDANSLAESLGVSTRRLRRLASDRVVVAAGRGMFDLVESLAGFEIYRRAIARSRRTATAGDQALDAAFDDAIENMRREVRT